MDSRKDQLQKQIIEAIKANDNDLYSLLKSQWAHRFGVESLEELDNLDLNQIKQQTPLEDNQKIDQSEDNFFEDDKPIAVKDYDNQKKEIQVESKREVKSVEIEKKESFGIKSYEITDKENYENKVVNQVRDNKKPPKVAALIPLPPKPKYSYLKKWLLRN